ncbi:MAG: hypothetical protein QX196_16065 [Methylococcaceae bacterium]|jgi:hypothetical protein
MDLAKVTHNKKEAKMLSYQTTNEIVNLTFSKEFLSVPELVRLIETLRLKELISKSQVTQDDIMNLDEDLKASWWNKNKDRFLIKIE